MKLLKNVLFSVLFIFSASVAISSCAVPKEAAAGYTIDEAATNVHSVGRSNLTFTVKDNGTAKAGLTLEVEPMMTMTMMGSTYVHTTPAESTIATDNNDGTYSVTFYYVMSGSWELHFHINGVHQDTHIPVTVGGTMMDKGTLKGIADKTVDPAGSVTPKVRSYHIFKSAINTSGAAGTHSLDIFLATTESYLNMPAVVTGMTLNDGTPAPWTVGAVSIDVCTAAGSWNNNGTASIPGTDNSTDDSYTCTTWTNLPADVLNPGHYKATGLTIVDTHNPDGMSMMPQFAVRLNVGNSDIANSGWKTNSGTASAVNPGTGNGTRNSTTSGNEMTHISQ